MMYLSIMRPHKNRDSIYQIVHELIEVAPLGLKTGWSEFLSCTGYQVE